jgi:hypothetical protein
MASESVQARYAQQQLLRRCHYACRITGVKYVGIQNGYGITPDLLLFQAGEGSTLAVPAATVTPLDITFRVADSRKQFEKVAA